MLESLPFFSLARLGWAAPAASAPKPRNTAYDTETRAVIVVTGMRLNEDTESVRTDLAVAQNARVQVTAPDGTSREKRTEAFVRPGRSDSETWHTADFTVELDATYRIAMTFADGARVQIDDYVLPREWKTHFLFHSTNGSKSPASVLRSVEDSRTRQRCCVYAVFPLENYRALGGRQIGENGE